MNAHVKNTRCRRNKNKPYKVVRTHYAVKRALINCWHANDWPKKKITKNQLVESQTETYKSLDPAFLEYRLIFIDIDRERNMRCW